MAWPGSALLCRAPRGIALSGNAVQSKPRTRNGYFGSRFFALVRGGRRRRRPGEAMGRHEGVKEDLDLCERFHMDWSTVGRLDFRDDQNCSVILLRWRSGRAQCLSCRWWLTAAAVAMRADGAEERQPNSASTAAFCAPISHSIQTASRDLLAGLKNCGARLNAGTILTMRNRYDGCPRVSHLPQCQVMPAFTLNWIMGFFCRSHQTFGLRNHQ